MIERREPEIDGEKVAQKVESHHWQPRWEQQVLEKVVLAAVEEQKRARRWGIFFKFLGFGFLALMLVALIGFENVSGDTLGKRHTALVNLEGVIKPGGEVNADDINSALEAAFEAQQSVGVILRINSPGGSPVQAGIINDKIRQLRKKYPKKSVFAVVEDVCASGGYYIAVAADKIFVDKASIIGSIGVLMDGFGFIDSMQKLGIERRLQTAGENKGFLDPFSPENQLHKQHAQVILDEIHQQFIKVVREGRGERLKETHETFSGLMWTGSKSIELGLADELGNIDYVAREVIKAEEIRDYTIKPNYAEKLVERLGMSLTATLAQLFGQFSLR